MTVLPFERLGPEPSSGQCAADPVLVTGGFVASRSGGGAFLGTYRLLRVLTDGEQLAAAGVFAGNLIEADGRILGMTSRRATVAVTLDSSVSPPRLAIGPVDISLLGLFVTIAPFIVSAPWERHSLRPL